MAINEERIEVAADILHIHKEKLSQLLLNDNPKKIVERLLSVEETEKITGVSYFTLRRQIKRKKLRATRIGRRLRFHPDDIKEFIDNCRQEKGKNEN